MYNVYHNSLNVAHSYNSFSENFIEVCKQHKAEDRALAFAFILYDFEDPHLTKVLNDNDYWIALNKISGKYLSVFSIHYKHTQIAHHNNNSDLTMSYMIGASDYRNPSESTNEIINKYFHDDIKLTYPAVLFFQIDETKVTDALLIGLNEQTIEASFLELKDYLKSAALALKKITPENKGNYKEIFDQMELSIRATKSIKKFKRYAGIAKSAVELASAIKGL